MNATIRRMLTILALLTVLALDCVPVLGAPAHSGQITHVVRWGETLESIAYRYGTTVSAIVQANHLANPNYIYAGQVLIIPTGGYPAAPSSGTRYVVQWGDSLTSIAYRFGVTLQALMAANRLSNPNFIYAGQVLLIPTGAAAPSYPAATYYTVRPGDTLSRIAMLYGTTIWALVQANNLRNPSLIYVGQRLIIPGYVRPPAPYPPVPPPWPPYPTPVPPPVTPIWVGRITQSDCTNQDTWEFRSVLRVSVTGMKGLRVKVSSDGWETTGLTGTKPEYGEFAVEFAPFNQGYYTITPEGLGASVQVRLDGRCTAYVQFDPIYVSPPAPR